MVSVGACVHTGLGYSIMAFGDGISLLYTIEYGSRNGSGLDKVCRIGMHGS